MLLIMAGHSHFLSIYGKIQHLFSRRSKPIQLFIHSITLSSFLTFFVRNHHNPKSKFPFPAMLLSLAICTFWNNSSVIQKLDRHMDSQQHRQTKLRNSSQLRRSHSSEQKRWGKYRTIMGKNNKGQPLLTLGPNFITLTACFVTLNLFTILFLYRLRKLEEAASFFLILTFNIIFVDLAWLTTAFLNPGISAPCPEEQGQICQECLATNKIQIAKKMNRYHCQQCDICIDQHQAHLKLLGCCVGKQNFTAFKVFLLSLFLWGLSMITIIQLTYNL